MPSTARRTTSADAAPNDPAADPGQQESTPSSSPPAHPDPLRLVRLVLPWAIVAGILAVVGRIAALPIYNTDTYFHLRFGHEFLDGWSLRDPGSVSTFATAHWLPTQWLPQMVMAKTEDWFGLAGVAWLSGLQMVLLVVTLFLVSRRWASPMTVVLAMVVALVAMHDSFSMRPQVLSYVFVIVVLGAWLRTRDDGRLRWWLVPLTWLWAMVHGMWPIGIVLGVVALVGLALDRRFGPRELLRAAGIPVLSAVACALTPVGPRLYGAVLAVNDRSKFFTEWGSPDFASVAGVMLGLLLAVTLVLATRGGRLPWLDLLMLVVAAACAVWSWRTVPVAAVMLVLLLAVQVRRRSDDSRGSPPTRRETLAVWAAGIVTLAGVALAVPSTSDQPPRELASDTDALASLPSGTKVVDDWDIGGFLMWRYPGLDLLGHGYGDTFTFSELQRNLDIQNLEPGWDRELRQTGCTVAVLRPEDPLTYALVHQAGWQVTHRGTTLEVLRAPAGWPSNSSG